MIKKVSDLVIGDEIETCNGFSSGCSTLIVQALAPVPGYQDLMFVVMTDKRKEITENTQVITDLSNFDSAYEVIVETNLSSTVPHELPPGNHNRLLP